MITILCSAVALGVYTPAILLREEMGRSHAIDLEVLENLYPLEKKLKLQDNKKVFSANFEVAKMGHKIVKDIVPHLDQDLVTQLLSKWKDESREAFIVFSGFWIPIVEAYAKKVPKTIHVDCIHMDAALSPSWKKYQSIIDSGLFSVQDIWLFDGVNTRVNYRIPFTKDTPKDYKARDNRFIIHGGGWGMGTYKEKIAALDERLDLNIILHDLNDYKKHENKHRYYMVKPDWSPWMKNKEQTYSLPPFGEIIAGHFTEDGVAKHPFYELICHSKAIISKPGGGTLLDSLESFTPIIFLEPLGEHEANNAVLWERLGFGIGYEQWVDTGYSMEILEELADNLKRARNDVFQYGRGYDEAATDIRTYGQGLV